MRVTHDEKVVQKKERLFKIAAFSDEQFAVEDLSNPCTVNTIAVFCKGAHKDDCVTLLSVAYKAQQFQKIEQLINANVNVKLKFNNNLLNKIARNRCKPKHVNDRDMYLYIAELLLTHGADPDFRANPRDPTPLMIAVCHDDKEYARSLVWHKADPCKKGTWTDSSLKNSFEIEKAKNYFSENNAFEMETTGWLKKMVNEIAYEKKQIPHIYLLLTTSLVDTRIFPLEVMQLIMYNVWTICRHRQIQ
jgi:ankyrin repeat protein